MKAIGYKRRNKLVQIFKGWVIAILLIVSQNGVHADDSSQMVVQELISAIKDNQNAVQWLYIDDLASRCVGDLNLTGAQYQDFIDILKLIFEKVAFKKSASFFQDLEIEFLGESVKDDFVVVSTSFFHPDEGLIDIDYYLKKFQDQWLIFDVSLDGVSLARDMQNQIRKIFQDEGFDELIRRMKEKIREQESKGFVN